MEKVPTNRDAHRVPEEKWMEYARHVSTRLAVRNAYPI